MIKTIMLHRQNARKLMAPSKVVVGNVTVTEKNYLLHWSLAVIGIYILPQKYTYLQAIVLSQGLGLVVRTLNME